jgi:hypothetical protein
MAGIDPFPGFGIQASPVQGVVMQADSDGGLKRPVFRPDRIRAFTGEGRRFLSRRAAGIFPAGSRGRPAARLLLLLRRPGERERDDKPDHRQNKQR